MRPVSEQVVAPEVEHVAAAPRFSGVVTSVAVAV
jgi:hypothetical protein